VNNAGVGLYGPVAQAELERLVAMVRLNCEALVRLTHAFLPELERAGCGFILNVASAAAFQPTPYMSAYGASKAFVLSFTEGLAEELRGGPVRTGALCPGPVATEFGEVAGTGHRFGAPPGLLSADGAAREALAQLRSRGVVRVPRLVYKLTTAALRALPRGLVRRISGQAHRPKALVRFGPRRPLVGNEEDA
jgi:short-subunit dehydrogenase